MNDNATPLQIDARELACPQPVLLLRQALKGLSPGAQISLLTTDPMASIDVRAFCLRARHRLLTEEDCGAHSRFLIERG